MTTGASKAAFLAGANREAWLGWLRWMAPVGVSGGWIVSDEGILDTVSRIHAAGLEPALWPDALGAVTRLVGGNAATVEVIARDNFTHRAFFGFGVPPREELAYLGQYAAISPRIPDAMRRRRGEVVWDFQILDDKGMDRSPFYQEFLRKLDMRYAVAGILNTDSRDFGAFAVQRSARQGHVGATEIALMSLIAPHVSQALDVTRRMRQANAGSRSLEQALDWLTDGVLLLDGSGKVRYINGAFEKISRARDGISFRRGALAFSSADARDHFRNALALLHDLADGRLAGRGSDFYVTRPSGMPSYLISIRPLVLSETCSARDAAATTMIFVRDPTPTNATGSHLLRQMLGLTDAEAALARALCAGVSPSQYAAERRLSLNTVYTHLSHIKQKANCRRMAELIRRLNDLQMPARVEE